MNVPHRESCQHGIITQVRVGSHDETHRHVVPPMSPVFVFEASKSTKRRKLNLGNIDVRTVSAQQGTEFVGVSVDGLADGRAIARFNEASNRLSVITRGMCTVMCDFDMVDKIPLLSPVKFEIRDATKAGFSGFHDDTVWYDLVEALPPNAAVGILIGKPSQRYKSNDARILLY